ALGSILLIGVGGWAAVRFGRSRPASRVQASPVQAPPPSVAAIESAAPAPPASASASPSAPIEAPPRSPESSGLRVICRPDCDAVYVDGKLAPNPSERVEMAPGRHVVTVTKTGSKPQNKQFFSVAGQDNDLEFGFGSA